MPQPTSLLSAGKLDSDIISIHNIDTEDFIFEYDRSRGNPPYVIPAGEIRRFPLYLARLALKHLIDKLITKKGEHTSNQQLRNELAEQIIVGTESLQRIPQKTEIERQREEVDALNVPSDLDKVLERHKEREKVKEPKEEFAGLKKREKGDAGLEVDIVGEEKAPKPEKVVKPVPTRNEIYQYGEKSLNLVIYDDEKTKKKLDRMSIPDLLKEVGDPREALR